MFVRWKKRQLSSDINTPEARNISLYAVLVENHRIEGKTRQTVVKYLGYINEAHLGDTLHQERFWQQVMGNLRTLGMEESKEDYRRIVSKLLEVVPNPHPPAEPAKLSAPTESSEPPTPSPDTTA